jgi:hypothetical protein
VPQPPTYNRQFDFTEHEAGSPSAPPPGPALDNEFDAAAVTLAAILANMAKIQRDDGALFNGIVSLDSLSPEALIVLGAGAVWNPRGVLTINTNYAVSDVVTFGTATFVSALAHNSGADIAADLAVAGRWVRIFDTAAVGVADGSITAPKLAPGAVTTPAIGFTSLDLLNTIRARGGLAAGTGTIGELLHAKRAAGAAQAKIERTTDAQGVVGYQIIGVGATWSLQMAASSNDLDLVVVDTIRVTFGNDGTIDVPGAVRVVTGAAPTDGNGAFMHFTGNIGFVRSFDFSAGVHRDLKIQGKDVFLTAGGVDVLQATSAGVNFMAPPSVNGAAIGFLGIPQIADSDARVLSAADNGEHIYSENIAGQTITVPAGLGTDFACLIVNDGSNPIALNGAGGMVMRLAATSSVSANRTIGAGGWCFIKVVKAGRAFVGGDGTS